jgi:chemotaxis protein methyltransferase CheR
MTHLSFDFDYLRHLLQSHTAVVLEPHKYYLAELHLDAIARQSGSHSIAEFVEKIKALPFGKLHVQTIEALLINETSFFRDRYPFEALRFVILPALIQSRSIEKTITIWCAACSTGQEPYSIAMLIQEYFPQLANWKIRIIASDFSGKALARAKQGSYTSTEVNRGLTPEQRDRYFQQSNGFWKIRSEIIQRVEFRQMNLIGSWSNLPTLDIIFLRNVLIYFNIETKRTILKQVQQYMHQESSLFLGSGETTLYIDPTFEPIRHENAVYHRLTH